ncbi:hypothetical protein EDB85DRAFT_2278945 [Lactarius pseudohatsudake]|nr:hypothetical protein EDB85DRAFT_2278945 [Lactarius pseudohatsudake]
MRKQCVEDSVLRKNVPRNACNIQDRQRRVDYPNPFPLCPPLSSSPSFLRVAPPALSSSTLPPSPRDVDAKEGGCLSRPRLCGNGKGPAPPPRLREQAGRKLRIGVPPSLPLARHPRPNFSVVYTNWGRTGVARSPPHPFAPPAPICARRSRPPFRLPPPLVHKGNARAWAARAPLSAATSPFTHIGCTQTGVTWEWLAPPTLLRPRFDLRPQGAGVPVQKREGALPFPPVLTTGGAHANPEVARPSLPLFTRKGGTWTGPARKLTGGASPPVAGMGRGGAQLPSPFCAPLPDRQTAAQNVDARARAAAHVRSRRAPSLQPAKQRRKRAGTPPSSAPVPGLTHAPLTLSQRNEVLERRLNSKLTGKRTGAWEGCDYVLSGTNLSSWFSTQTPRLCPSTVTRGVIPLHSGSLGIEDFLRKVAGHRLGDLGPSLHEGLALPVANGPALEGRCVIGRGGERGRAGCVDSRLSGHGSVSGRLAGFGGVRGRGDTVGRDSRCAFKGCRGRSSSGEHVHFSPTSQVRLGAPVDVINVSEEGVFSRSSILNGLKGIKMSPWWGGDRCNGEVAVAAMPVWRVESGGGGGRVKTVLWVACGVETAPMRRGQVNEAGDDGSRGGSGGRVETAPVQRGRGGWRWWKRRSEVTAATVSRWRRCGGVLVVAGSVEPGCRGHVGVAGSQSRGSGCRTHLSGLKCRKRDGDNDVACIHTCEWQAGRAARKPRGVKAMGGGLNDEGDTVLACTASHLREGEEGVAWRHDRGSVVTESCMSRWHDVGTKGGAFTQRGGGGREPACGRGWRQEPRADVWRGGGDVVL